MRWVGNGLRGRSEAQRFSGGYGCAVDHGLLVVEVFVERQQETGALAVADGSGDGAFVILAAFGGLDGGEGVAGVENGVAKHEVEGTVIDGRSAFGDDFQASATGAREARAVRIIVDLSFLDGGGS